jgi:hypothetical protein
MNLRLLAVWNWGFESRRGHGCLPLVSVVSFQVEISATVRSLAQRNNLECGVSEIDRGTSTFRRPRPTRFAEP